MCGIAGVVGADEDLLAVGRMVSVLEHRGPDETSYDHAISHAFASCRLAINGLADGSQPLRAPGITMIYNGEIYNHEELAAIATREGAVLSSSVDGAPVPHLFHQMGMPALSLLDGPFAVALWDSRKGMLVLARDPLGEKPLFYRRLSRGGLAFASEVRALRNVPNERASLDLNALWDLPTFLWVPEPSTVFNEIFAVPAGHALIFDGSEIHISRIPRRRHISPEPISDREAVDRTRVLVSEAVRSRAMSEVPIGTFLSGGLDSSLVTALLIDHARPLERTFSVQLPEFYDHQHGFVDEAAQARKFSEDLGVPYTTVRVSEARARELLLNFVSDSDEPNAVSSGLGVMAVAEAAREMGIKVLLSGDCADEAFGGYSWYPYIGEAGEPPYLNELEPSFQSHGLPLNLRLQELARISGPQRALAWHYYATEDAKRAIFSARVREAVEPSVRHLQRWRASPDWHYLDFVNNDRDFYLTQEMLRKADRYAMKRSVEVRVPFAAPWLLDFARRLSPEQLVRGDVLKWALRQAFSDLLPSDVIGRKKHGFNFPIAEWLRGPWSDLVEATFARDSALADYGLIHEGSMEGATHLLNDRDRDQGHAVFSWVVMGLWLERTSIDVDC